MTKYVGYPKHQNSIYCSKHSMYLLATRWFLTMQREMFHGEQVRELSHLSDTRWWCRAASCENVLVCLECIVRLLKGNFCRRYWSSCSILKRLTRSNRCQICPFTTLFHRNFWKNRQNIATASEARSGQWKRNYILNFTRIFSW